MKLEDWAAVKMQDTYMDTEVVIHKCAFNIKVQCLGRSKRLNIRPTRIRKPRDLAYLGSAAPRALTTYPLAHNGVVSAADTLACQPYEASATTPCERAERHGLGAIAFSHSGWTAGRMTPSLAFGSSVTGAKLR